MEKIPYSYSRNQTDSNPSTSTEDPTQSYSKVQAVTSEQLSVTSSRRQTPCAVRAQPKDEKYILLTSDS